MSPEAKQAADAIQHREFLNAPDADLNEVAEIVQQAIDAATDQAALAHYKVEQERDEARAQVADLLADYAALKADNARALQQRCGLELEIAKLREELDVARSELGRRAAATAKLREESRQAAECTHGLAEREAACYADGLCPICLSAATAKQAAEEWSGGIPELANEAEAYAKGYDAAMAKLRERYSSDWLCEECCSGPPECHCSCHKSK